LLALGIGALTLACDSPGSGNHQQATQADLAPGIVANVGSEPLSASFARAVARRHGLSPAEAVERGIADALFAETARVRFEGTGLLAVLERSADSRALLDAIYIEEKLRGPATAGELQEFKRERWMDFDRPPSVYTAHAVVSVENPEQADAAKAAAQRIAEAARGILELDAFVEAAQRVRTGKLKKRVETLPYMTADGRAVYLSPLDPQRSKPQKFDVTFARAAHAIREEGQQSPVVETRFGYHVILLVERLDAEHYSEPQLREALTKDVFDRRAKQRVDALRKRLTQASEIEVARNVDALTAKISLQP
jgi:hypothetical protein